MRYNRNYLDEEAKDRFMYNTFRKNLMREEIKEKEGNNPPSC